MKKHLLPILSLSALILSVVFAFILYREGGFASQDLGQLDPLCVPGAPGCDLAGIPALSGNNSDITSLTPAGNSLLISPSTGKVGIGTTSPAETLALFGALRLGNAASSTNGGTLYWDGSNILGYTSQGLVSLTSSTTISNIGIGSSTLGIFKQASGNTLQLKNIGTSTQSITLTDDTTNNLIKIGISDADLTLSNLGGVLDITRGGTGLSLIGPNQIYYATSTNGVIGLTLNSIFSTSTNYLSIASSSLNFSEIANALTLDSNLIIGAGNNYSITFATSTLHIDTLNNRIGIGTTSPQTTLYNTGTTTATYFQPFCPVGYIWVPGNPKHGTMPGFCVMKYEAKSDGSTNCLGGVCPVSKPETRGNTMGYANLYIARGKCEALGPRYHLLTDQEWMTMADNIASLPINDLDSDANLQLATGFNTTQNFWTFALVSTYGADPIVTGCNLMNNMEDSSNNYVAGSCEIRGDYSYGGDDNDKGYYGTNYAWSTTGYAAGGYNKSQLRTHVFSNGNVIWDMAGNLSELTDNYIFDYNASFEMPVPSDWISSSSGYYDYATTSDSYSYSYIVNYKGLGYIRPADPLINGNNGAGRIYLYNSRAGSIDSVSYDYNYTNTIRGGYCSLGTNGSGIYALDLFYSTDNLSSYRCFNFSFRCTYR